MSTVVLPSESSTGTRAAPAVKPAAVSARSYRLDSIDFLRGVIIVIMALDHVRDYFMLGSMQDPMSDPNVGPALFATRWITHFCAPVFVLLAGTSAGLMSARKSRSELGGFLLKRGLWLIFIEWFVVSTALTFAPFGIATMQGTIIIVFQVLWAIGVSMIVLAGAQFLGRAPCLWIGLAIVIAHNLLDSFWPANNIRDASQPLWAGLHSQTSVRIGPDLILNAYPPLPWIGVILTGFGIAGIFEKAPQYRDAILRRAGIAMIAAFVILRAPNLYGDWHTWKAVDGDVARSVMSFLNVTKYPPSLLYLLATLGPAAILCSYADRVQATVKSVFVTFGRVPFAFYIVHFYLIHACSILLGVAQGFDASQFLTINMMYPKTGYGLPLAGVYLVWICVVIVMYPFCRWVASVKSRRRDWWLSYL